MGADLGTAARAGLAIVGSSRTAGVRRGGPRPSTSVRRRWPRGARARIGRGPHEPARTGAHLAVQVRGVVGNVLHRRAPGVAPDGRLLGFGTYARSGWQGRVRTGYGCRTDGGRGGREHRWRQGWNEARPSRPCRRRLVGRAHRRSGRGPQLGVPEWLSGRRHFTVLWHHSQRRSRRRPRTTTRSRGATATRALRPTAVRPAPCGGSPP